MARKLAGLPHHGVPTALPGVDVVFSRHGSPYGAIPATVVAAPGTVVDVVVLAVTPAGLDALRATEPNYDLTELAGMHAFTSRHGPLLLAGAPVALAAVAARGRALPALTEAALLERVRDRVAPDLDLAGFVARLAREAEFRDRVHRAL